MRKKYLRVSRILFHTAWIMLAVGIVLMILLPHYIPRNESYRQIAGYFAGITFLTGILGFIPAACYFALCCGRSFTQQIRIKDGKLKYRIYSGSGEDNREYKRYTFSEIYKYRITPRAIMLKGDGKRLTLWVPRTFTDEEQFIEYLESHLVPSKQKERA